MGLDYIRAQTGKPWRKRWDGGLNRLKSPTLFDLTMSETARTVTARIEKGVCVETGATVIVEIGASGLTISDGLRAIGSIDNPAADIAAGIRASGGYAEGICQRVGLFGDTVEISVR